MNHHDLRTDSKSTKVTLPLAMVIFSGKPFVSLSCGGMELSSIRLTNVRTDFLIDQNE